LIAGPYKATPFKVKPMGFIVVKIASLIPLELLRKYGSFGR